jgi:hypothetical protein
MTNKTKQQAYRHGELTFVVIDKLPDGLKKENTKVFTTGSHGHSHSFTNGELYLKKENDFIIGYFVAEDTYLIHLEHSPKIGDAKLPDGVYQVRHQNEHTPKGLKQVID